MIRPLDLRSYCPLSKLKSTLMTSNVYSMLFAFLLSLRILKSTTSWSLQSRLSDCHICDQFFFDELKICEVPPTVILSGFCIKILFLVVSIILLVPCYFAVTEGLRMVKVILWLKSSHGRRSSLSMIKFQWTRLPPRGHL